MPADRSENEDAEFHALGDEGNRAIVFIKELTERDRPFLLNHFKALDANDRYLRFGSALTDEAIARYVDNIDFTKDTMFGVYESTLNIVGVGHLSLAQPEALPVLTGCERRESIAEFGVSVLAPARRLSVGTKLFERAVVHCRNKNIDTMYIHCLASNKPMLCIAKKAGMQIHRDHGEVDGYLKLPLGDKDSRRHETVEERAATLNYILGGKFKGSIDWLRKLFNPDINGKPKG
ncbi:MAG: Acetyltransferase family protein [Burkholderiaceae bacterium]|nr:Acetyltransferase family protein [Burkholderiaceae bacterium]